MAIPQVGKVYNIESVEYPGYNLNFLGGIGFKDGTNVTLWNHDENDTDQQWTLKSDNKLYPKLTSSFCLDRYVTAGSYYNNADIWTNNDPVQQSVAFVETSGGVMIRLRGATYQGKPIYLTAPPLVSANSNNNPNVSKLPGSKDNVYWANEFVSPTNRQLWNFKEIGGSSGGIIGGGYGNGDITVGERPSTLDYDRDCYMETNRFPVAQCTWHCYGRAYEVLGKVIEFSPGTRPGLGLCGAVWYDCILNGERSQTPEANSIAVWDDGTTGHVAYVEQVVGDTVYISEANWGTNNIVGVLDALDGTVRTFSKSNPVRGGMQLRGYVHLNI